MCAASESNFSISLETHKDNVIKRETASQGRDCGNMPVEREVMLTDRTAYLHIFIHSYFFKKEFFVSSNDNFS